jgi:hypothetical protein
MSSHNFVLLFCPATLDKYLHLKHHNFLWKLYIGLFLGMFILVAFMHMVHRENIGSSKRAQITYQYISLYCVYKIIFASLQSCEVG